MELCDEIDAWLVDERSGNGHDQHRDWASCLSNSYLPVAFILGSLDSGPFSFLPRAFP
jgi:hypothetical protein